jgi:hypothetical protein
MMMCCMTPPPSLRTNRTRCVPHPVLIGHAASFTMTPCTAMPRARDANAHRLRARDTRSKRRRRGQETERQARAARDARAQQEGGRGHPGVERDPAGWEEEREYGRGTRMGNGREGGWEEEVDLHAAD